MSAEHDDRVRPMLLAQAAKRGAFDWNYQDVEPVIAELLERTDLLPPPAVDYVAGLLPVPMDDAINDLGWKMADWLGKNGAQYDGRVFNHIKGFLATVIEEWVRSRPAARPASPEPDEDPEDLVAADERALDASPDTRVVERTVLQGLYDLLCNMSGDTTDDDNEIRQAAAQVRAIIGGPDRG